ncbi:MAG: hypothetical protein NTW30_06285 [Candidatus Aenigmarchaeota archaeon]|nr:hypothetical protein [Candidatus Aenigmarchaeota archaeon]
MNPLGHNQLITQIKSGQRIADPVSPDIENILEEIDATNKVIVNLIGMIDK